MLRKFQTFYADLGQPSIVTALLCLFLVAACAEQPTERLGVSSQEGCDLLHQIIAEYPSQFEKFRRGASSSNPWQNNNIWNAKPVFPDTTCQIWGWAKGRSNFSCEWKESDQENAKAAYEKYKPKIHACLGDQWRATEPKTKTGQHTVFHSQTTNAVVSIRYFQDTQKAFSKPWYTSMVIGDYIETVNQ